MRRIPPLSSYRHPSKHSAKHPDEEGKAAVMRALWARFYGKTCGRCGNPLEPGEKVFYGVCWEGYRFIGFKQPVWRQQTGAPERFTVPTGVAVFSEDIAIRRYAEREHNIVHWTDFDRGGHFAAMEEPDLLVGDVRKFFRRLR
jgi:pimeloyl-ACP methyl ester carboxylesterase